MTTCRPLVLAGFAMLSVATSASAVPSPEAALADWASVLERFVDEEGRTDFAALAADRGALDRFVRFVGELSPKRVPELFPTPEAVLAYHINAYNALAMQGVIEAGIPESFGSFFKRAGFFKLRKVTIGGEVTSLYDYENEVIRPLGEPRIHFALNCMARHCPRLPREPFRAASLDAELEAAAREFCGSETYVRLDGDRKEVSLSEIFDFYTEDFVGANDPKALIAYVNRYRAEAVPADYGVRFIPYDWTINRQP